MFTWNLKLKPHDPKGTEYGVQLQTPLKTLDEVKALFPDHEITEQTNDVPAPAPDWRWEPPTNPEATQPE